jgi:N-acetylmuramoyl-L-alanine amidase
MRHLVAVAIAAALLTSAAAWAAKADDAYEAAKASYLALKKDEARRRLRHHWQEVARKFEAVARKHPKSERAPEALFMAGQVNNELSRISGRDDDVAEAEKCYRRLIDGWPRHRLTDDATLALARLLADRREDWSAARALLEAGLPHAEDQQVAMKRLLSALSKGPGARKSPSPARVSGGADTSAPARAVRGDGDGSAGAEQAGGRGDVAGRTGEGARAAEGKAKEGGRHDDGLAAVATGPMGAGDGSAAGAGGAKKPRGWEGGKALTLAAKAALRDAGKAQEVRARLTAPATDVEERGPRPAERRPASADESEPAPALSLADAIRRATSPLAHLTGLPADEAPQARRAPPTRPTDTVASGSDEVLDEAEDSPLASFQERLRDVRVGDRPGAAEATDAKSRFARLAKDEADAELTLAQQLGLKVKRVVVDPGHGGHDTGAIGKNGTREKDVALAIAKKLAARLKAQGLEVVLTREDDTFVKLEDRTSIANRVKGDLFISVHCNAAPSSRLRGVETYTLNTSSNRYAIRLAARENATTERGVGDLQYILADLATKANTGESNRLAARVQQTLVRNLSASYENVKNLGHKEALFFVLLGARMPAVLVETSFLSNEEEEARLADDAYQQAVADAIAEAVQGFLDERSRLAQVD